MGMVQPKSGIIRHNGAEVQNLPPYELAKRGIQLVPEERRIFGQITVQENLQLAAMIAEKSRTLDEINEPFPRLPEPKPNRARQLSGGAHQILTFAEEKRTSVWRGRRGSARAQ